ncbi:M23 family metallopeptidase [Olivibacter sitiensis]|uniref:M23 family metallopeptidase n=1 Tax=Olivibacter sitiensis TaxID=376470 RepID=UPI000429BA5D|nr:M23 family metallopeptidase [Olivibacter sitiensis]
MKFNKHTLFVLGALVFILGLGFFAFSAFNVEKTKNKKESAVQIEVPKKVSKVEFGLIVDSFLVEQRTVQRNELLGSMLGSEFNAQQIDEIAKKSKDVYDVRRIAAGKPYSLYYANDSKRLAYMVYQPNAIDYVVYDLRDSIQVFSGKKEVETKIETLYGSINGSLHEVFSQQGADPALAFQLAQIYGGTIDFYRLNRGDWFKLEYERQYVEGESIGQGKILAAVFGHRNKEFEAYYFKPEGEKQGSYYDAEGNSLQRAFLKAPLKFSRISSRFSLRRLHPVQKTWKAHLGTDYAAPTGTPIIATANGVVSESGYSGGNGNYVKIQHDKTYATQYLHMSKRAVSRGQRIRQGQVIGYVGSTGLATGPHVCYRFWKNGKQVDPLRQNFQNAGIPLDKKYLTAFKQTIENKQQLLAQIQIGEQEDHTLLSANAEEEETAEKKL